MVADVGSELKGLILEFREDPVGFAEVVLGVDLAFAPSRAILEGVLNHRQVAVAACHASTKTFTAAIACLWFFYTQIPSKVVTTAPNRRQVEELLWSEIRKLHANARIPLPGDPLTNFLQMPSPANREGRNADWFMTGFATRADQAVEHATRFQGYHQVNVLVVFDEAAGILRPIWDAADGVMTGANPHWLAIGNPTDGAGPFARAFESRDWHSIRIDAYESPNVKEKRIVLPYLVDWEWVERQRRKYGEDSPVFQARVRGLFPKQATDTLIGIGDFEEALRREPPPLERPVRSIGCDVARFGNARTAIYCVEGAEVLERKTWGGQDLMRTAGEVIAMARRWDFTPGDADRIAIDDTGLGGGVTDRLHEQGWEVVAVNFGSVPKFDPGTFKNRRSELWWTLREWVRGEAAWSRLGEIDADIVEDLRADLTAPKYKMGSSGKIELEAKEKLQKRLGHSPDDGDALALALAWRRPTTGGQRAEWPAHLFEDLELEGWREREEYSVLIVAAHLYDSGPDAIVIMGRTRAGEIHVEADLVRGSVTDTLEAIADHAHRHVPNAIAFVEAQLDGLIRSRIGDAMKRRGFAVPVGALRLTADEDLRIRRLDPYLSRRLFRFRDDSTATAGLVRGLKDFPGGSDKSLPSILEMALRVGVRLYNASTKTAGGFERLPID